MKLYQHKYDSSRTVKAMQVGVGNSAEEVAEWCGGFVVEEKDALTDYVTEAVQFKSGDSNVRAHDSDYVVLEQATGVFHLRSEATFEAKYVEAESQDEELVFENETSGDDPVYNQPFSESLTKTDDPFENVPRVNEPTDNE